jgi:hypothetical protein
MYHEYCVIQVKLSFYGLDEDSNEDCEAIENRIYIELVQKFSRIFILGDSCCKEYCDIEVDASLGKPAGQIRKRQTRVARRAGLTPIPTISGLEIIPGQLASAMTVGSVKT